MDEIRLEVNPVGSEDIEEFILESEDLVRPIGIECSVCVSRDDERVVMVRYSNTAN